MLMLGVSAFAFVLAHLIPAAPGIRSRLVSALGERVYLTLYSIVSLGLLFWVAIAAVAAPTVVLWPSPAITHVAPLALMPLAFMLIGAGLAAPNPLSVSLSTAPFRPDAPGLPGLIRHPVMWGFGLWSASHIPPNGVLGQALFFIAMTAFAIAGAWRIDTRRKRSLGAAQWEALNESRRAPVMRCLFDRRTLFGAAIGLSLYVGFLLSWHGLLFGVDPLWALSTHAGG